LEGLPGLVGGDGGETGWRGLFHQLGLVSNLTLGRGAGKGTGGG